MTVLLRNKIDRVVRLCSIFLLSSVFVGCGSLVSKPENIEDVVEEKRVVTPNPYLAQKASVDEEVKFLYQSAVESLSNDQLDMAEQQFIAIHELYPQLSGPLVNLGIVQYKRGDLDEAEELWLQAIEANDLNFDAYNYLGLIYREKGQFVDAEIMYKNALKKWDDNADIHCNLGILYDLYMGQPQMALEEYKVCQLLTEEPSRQLRGWIVDLERRIPVISNENPKYN